MLLTPPRKRRHGRPQEESSKRQAGLEAAARVLILEETVKTNIQAQDWLV